MATCWACCEPAKGVLNGILSSHGSPFNRPDPATGVQVVGKRPKRCPFSPNTSPTSQVCTGRKCECVWKQSWSNLGSFCNWMYWRNIYNYPRFFKTFFHFCFRMLRYQRLATRRRHLQWAYRDIDPTIFICRSFCWGVSGLNIQDHLSSWKGARICCARFSTIKRDDQFSESHRDVVPVWFCPNMGPPESKIKS